jgi:DNA repair protein RadD
MTALIHNPASAINLRDYQLRDMMAVLACLSRNESVIRQLPTGGGKGVEIAWLTAIGAPDRDWVIYGHRIEIVDQISAHLAAAGVPFGLLVPGQDLTSHRIHVASIDTISARAKTSSQYRRWLAATTALADEAHHSAADSWADVLMLAPQRVGFTATPSRLDGRGLADDGMFQQMIIGPTIKQLQAAGYLAPSLTFAPPSGIDLAGVGKRGGDYKLGQVAAIVDTPEFAAMARRWYAKICPGQPAIVFCTTVEHALHVAESFRQAGWLSEAVYGDLDAAERRRRIRGLADGGVQVLTNCQIVSEGTDVPAVACSISLRPTASTTFHLQTIGRTLRPHVDKSAAIQIDLVGNTFRHGLVEADRIWDLHAGMRGIERIVAATWRCARCHLIHEIGSAGKSESCNCGNTGDRRGSGFVPAEIDGHPLIAGFAAVDIMRLPFQQAVPILRQFASRQDFIAYARLKKYPRPIAWADEQLRSARVAS